MDARGNADLLAGCARGEQDAWDEIVERFGRLIWTVIRSYRIRPVDAEDVRQLTWYRLVQNVDRIRDPDRLGDWLATVARRESIKAATRGKRLVMFGDNHILEGLAEHGESPEEIALRAHRNEEVLQAIDQMSGRCRELLLRSLQDPPASYEQISDALSMPVGSVGPIRTRCLRRLRRALTGDHPGAAGALPGCGGCPAATTEAAGPEPARQPVGAGAGREAGPGWT